MRSTINKYFIGGLLKDAKAFDIARVKLVYSFTLFYYLSSTIGAIMLLQADAKSIEGWVGFVSVLVFTSVILYLLRQNRLSHAAVAYFIMHFWFGTLIFIGRHGAYTPMDAGMMIILILFAFLTLGRTFGLIWTSYMLIMVGLASLEKIYPGAIFDHSVPTAMDEDPVGMIMLPAVLAMYILWVYLKAKENAEVQIEKQKEQIEETHHEIQASIVYAKRIQTAILPPDKLIKSGLPDSFVMYNPKDVVAGDFYWFQEISGSTYFAAADCTGHGVPGAMVSVICNNALNRAVKEFGETEVGKILDRTREIVLEEFEKSEEEVKDGMDISLCLLNGMSLEFAGAHNPLWLVRDGELIETKGDKQPIGKFEHAKPFSSSKIELKAGDQFYIFTDGLPDQFGGPKGKKFKYKQFKELLVSISELSMDDQKSRIEHVLADWMGELEQVDDICVIGVKV